MVSLCNIVNLSKKLMCLGAIICYKFVIIAPINPGKF